ncbi:MAG: hypothetical protein R2770_21215 [Acidimicrobiales bacterium]
MGIGGTLYQAAVTAITLALQDLVTPAGVRVIAIDGRSGAGKSTLAAQLARHLGSTVVEGDDFYSGEAIDRWLEMTPSQRADHCIDWRRQRPVLEALRQGRPAQYHAYDWEAFDGSLSSVPTTLEPTPTVILEGAYSARPELSDLIDLRVLLDTDPQRRRAQLLDREGDEYRDDWELVWSSAEEHYFGAVMPPDAFDLVARPD